MFWLQKKEINAIVYTFSNNKYQGNDGIIDVNFSVKFQQFRYQHEMPDNTKVNLNISD